MWRRALTTIPKVGREEWASCGLLSRWLLVSRGAVLLLTVLSVALGTLFAALQGPVDWWLLPPLALGLVLAHAASNLINDLEDFHSGVDEGNYFRVQYGPHPILSGFLTEKELRTWAATTAAAALACGALLVWVRGPWVGLLALVGLVLALGYASRPGLKYLGLGEVAVFLIWGPLMVAGSAFVLTGALSLFALLGAIPSGLGATLVILGKHIDKLQDDARRGIRTLPVILGEPRARFAMRVLLVAMPASVVALVLGGRLPVPSLLALLSLPVAVPAWRVLRGPHPENPPPGYPAGAWPLWFVGFGFLLNRSFAGWYAVGLVLALGLHVLGVRLPDL
ncbi:MAG: prenyltransferase [Euryarchaeota archaeon]|nr:prenyltransferase [Euryarchaeota archaeon]MDE1835639.1 prenyltransferase [Euryarchaeota archaeon]MDE1878987.1 prenyltransferase [Euryarchaeota archaeon]MDE2043739.1 prenyltransferase [Thermoplasmata archaeon]